MKDWIDTADYEHLVARWLFAKGDSPFFSEENLPYYAHVVRERAQALSEEEERAILARFRPNEAYPVASKVRALMEYTSALSTDSQTPLPLTLPPKRGGGG
jgi:hypothetical protein